jgi:hypothetical protein
MTEKGRLAAITMLAGVLLAWFAGSPAGAHPVQKKPFEFPTSENHASFHFTSFPDLYNWNIKYPQPGWEDAMDWFLAGMKKEGPAFSLNAGDIMDARWWDTPKQVREKTNEYWGGFKKRFEDKNIKLYIAPGDHEYGDDQGLTKRKLTPVYGEQFSRIFNMPRNGPEHKKGRAYAFVKENLAVISVDTFEHVGKRMRMQVTGKQLAWVEQQLKKHQDKDFIIVQGHVPVIGPVRSKSSSANMLRGRGKSEFWKLMVEYGVDVYLCGEHHRITAKKRDGIWQVVHGALWGTHTDPNYLRGSVWDDKLQLDLFRLQVEYSGGHLPDQHPHRSHTNTPHAKVRISDKTRRHGPEHAGTLVIEKGADGNNTTKAMGDFARYLE